MQSVKIISKIFGLIVSIWFFWSIFLFLLVDKTKPQWTDVGWLEILIMNVGITLGSAEVLISSVISYLIIIFIIKKEIIKFRMITMFSLAYIITLILSFLLKVFYLTNLNMGVLSYENILSILFLPLIFNLLIFNILKFHK
jgi:hypothetical protein